MIKLVAISDLHGFLPSYVHKADALLIAGDICPGGTVNEQLEWLYNEFKPWLLKHNIPTYATWGNHDEVAESDLINYEDIPCRFLVDESVKLGDELLYATPWTNALYTKRWAFGSREDRLVYQWEGIPEDVTILMTHSPPLGWGDTVYTYGKKEHIGSESLAARIEKLNHLKLHVFGHCHEGYGEYFPKKKHVPLLCNVSLLNERYQPVYQQKVFVLGKPAGVFKDE